MNTHLIRKYLRKYFSILSNEIHPICLQHTFCTKYDFKINLIAHQVNFPTRYKLCNKTKVFTDINLIFSMFINTLKKKSFNLNGLLNISFSHWYKLYDISCERCAGNKLLFKNKIKLIIDIKRHGSVSHQV